ncbi:MAG: beta-lactamase family protein [Bacteroidales bacterium]|nr:beta-lactamase family protein [Bacteroidales bacterium]
MSRNRKKRGFPAIAVTLFAVVSVFLAVNVARGMRCEQPEAEEQTAPVRLRGRLTNEQSQNPAIDRRVEKYMRDWELKGVSLSIMRNDSLVYSRGYGIADKNVAMTPDHSLRIASVSKLITAAGIMVLEERGLLSLDSKVFGEEGLLSGEDYVYKDRNFEKITVAHLLRHQGGFRIDPLFIAEDVRNTLGLKDAPEAEHLIELTMRNSLRFEPGTSQRYSNMGYFFLSRIIETLSGQSYEDFIRGNVLEPAGCYDFHISGNYYEEKDSLDTRQYTHTGDGQYVTDYHGNGKMVERSYGGNDIRMCSGAGAWTATTAELCRFVASIDGRPEVPDIISRESVDKMTEYIDENTFSLGWNDTNPEKGWNRTGSFSGTSALVQYFPDGECWVMVTNTSTWRGPSQSKYCLALFQECRADLSLNLPHIDLFN